MAIHPLPENPSPFEPFKQRPTALLTSFKRDGSPVETPVSIAVEDDHAYFRTYDKAWKSKRLRRNPFVRVAPSTFRGKPLGDELAAHARLLHGEEEAHAARMLARRQRILQGVLVPVLHKVMRYRTLHYELTA